MNKIAYLLTFLLGLFSIDCSAFSRYVTNNLNLRSAPNTKSSIIAVIPKGTVVTINEDCDCLWVPVEYNGRIGYISTRYLSNYPVRNNSTYRNKKTSYRKRHSSSTQVRRGQRFYTNTYGNRVQSPTYYESVPAGATALCRDGTYSFSQSRRGTCSHHGGVARWY